MWMHDNPITVKEAKNTGGSLLTVRSAKISELYLQTMQQRPSIKYLSVLYKMVEEKEKLR